MQKYFIFILLFIPLILNSQNYSDDQIKAAYIYNFLVNIEWPDEDNLDEFKICVLGTDTTIVPFLKSLASSKKIRNIDISIYTTESLSDILTLSPQVVYVPESDVGNLKKIYYEILTNPILLITDNSTQLLYVMLNFKVSADNKIEFDLNTQNIENQGLKILPKLLVLGGTELQVRELYQLKEQELQNEREIIRLMEERLLKQQLLIDSQLVEIQKQNELIEIRKKSIDSLRNQIVKQKAILDNQSENLEELQFNIKQQQNLLSQKIIELNAQQDSIQKQKDLISTQQIEIEEKLTKLNQLNSDIALRETEIENQKNELNNLQGTVENQRLYLLFMAVILALVVFIIIYIYRNFREKKKLNDKLVQKNHEVESQSEELKQINLELVSQKDQIQHQNDYITDSIHTSKRIQTAILPAFKGLRASFDSLLIYKPKDIVSGDFYWGEEVKNQTIDYKFIGVLDCTGHGVPGALLSIVGSRILSEIVLQHNIYEPKHILDALNKMIKGILKQDISNKEIRTNEGMDASLCRIEKNDKNFKFTFSGAKQSIFYYKSSSQEVNRIKGSRLTIGGIFQNKNEKFENHSFTVQKNDVVYLITDGFIDQNNIDRKRFGTPRFKELISEIAQLPAKEQEKVFEEHLQVWKGEEPQRDDITLLGLRIK